MNQITRKRSEVPHNLGSFSVPNPKRATGGSGSFEDELIFPYYAGFSMQFASSLLTRWKEVYGGVVVDPWNGSGTVTSAASRLGIQSIGIDLNPVMVLVAKTRLLSRHDVGSIVPLGTHILEESKNEKIYIDNDDLLHNWFDRPSVRIIKQVESVINRLLVSESAYHSLTNTEYLGEISSLGSFFYVSMFRTIRSILKQFTTTNPTWIKKAKTDSELIHITRTRLGQLYLTNIRILSELLALIPVDEHEKISTKILSCDSAKMPLETESADFVLTSPPYCTRIDYAVATSPELAVIGMNQAKFKALRQRLIGTSSVAPEGLTPSNLWGPSCNSFLNSIQTHSSKASKQYYYKNHCHYFNGLFNSLTEIGRILKKNGICSLVIQDSYYKDLHNDLPHIACEMGANLGFRLVRLEEFYSKRSMVSINSRAKKYLNDRSVREKVIFLQK